MREPSELDIAQLKHEMRQLYKSVGFPFALKILAEMIIGARVLAEVIVEEKGGESYEN
jgi:hypothetical protein